MVDGEIGGPAVPIGDGLDRISEVAQQVPSIRNLYGVGSALADAVRVGTGAITCNNFDAGMALQPGRECRCLAVRQQVDDLVLLQIDQDGAVAMAAPPRRELAPNSLDIHLSGRSRER